MTRAEKARNYFLEGYACSQSVVMAFSDLVNVDIDTLKKLSLPLGGGLGRLRLTCGAVYGFSIICGLIFADSEKIEDNKVYVYSIVQELTNRFIKEKGTLNCKELLEQAELEVEVGGTPDARTEEYYNKRPCKNVVYVAAKILEEYLKEKGII